MPTLPIVTPKVPPMMMISAGMSMNAAGRAFLARSKPCLTIEFRSLSGPGTSSRTTGIPADAASAAIPLPIVPAPITPNLVMRIQVLSTNAFKETYPYL